MDSVSSSRSGRPRSAFTLIEVLVVVAIIALLISILLPSLRQAKEQAQVAVCLANLSQIGKGAMAYIGSERDRFPFLPNHHIVDDYKAAGYGPPAYSSMYGGNRSTAYGECDDVSPMQKPLNRYIYPGKLGIDLNRNRLRPGPLRTFQCPSDDGARWDQDLGSGLQAAYTCYTDIGTSYDENINWSFFIDAFENGSVQRKWQMIDRFVPLMRKKGASRVILVYEDVADYGLSNGLMNGLPPAYQVMGWHNKFNYASYLFLDGHAAYILTEWKKVKPVLVDGKYRGGCTATWAAHHDVGDN
jgi:prepilin-type N-terminal cleavage/methylation domain-containing protein/prepilin-type processing-associated H-X9-DG protein